MGKNALDLNVAAQLWEASERLTGVEWPLAYAPPSQFPWPLSKL